MTTMKWKDLKHKAPPQDREHIRQDAVAELGRIGYAAIRKARSLT